MGVGDFIKKLTLREWINIGFFVISLAMLIAGSVMLAVAIASIPPMPPFPEEIPTTTAVPVAVPVVIFTTSFANGQPWNNDLSNPSSASFNSLVNSLKTNISNSWTGVPTPLSTQINAFSEGKDGVNFYSEFIFADTSVTTSLISTVLAKEGYETNAYLSSTLQCSGLLPYVYQPPTETSFFPTQKTTTVPVRPGSICDASSKLLLNVFLVDISDPIIGTLDDKLKKISELLLDAPASINLKNSEQWDGQEFRLVAYGGNEPIPVGRARNTKSWNSVVGMMNSSLINPTKLDGHQLTDALRFVYNNYRLPFGNAGNIIVIGDGFDYDESDAAPIIANALKTQYFYSLGFLLVSTSQVQRSIVQSLATDFDHFYPLENFEYLTNPTILKIQAQWTCNAFFPTHAPPTIPPTRVPLLTTPIITNAPLKTTMNPMLPPVASCRLNVLFLIDQSQTMILNGYTSAVQFSIDSAILLSNININTTFAFIVYNRVVVAESNTYTDLQSFVNSIKNAPQSLGYSDAAVGFVEALNFIQTKAQYADSSVTSLLYFITDGQNLGSSISSAENATQKIRSLLQTEIIGIDLIETETSKQDIQSIIQFGVSDGFSRSLYVGVNEPNDALDKKFINSTIYELQCKGSTTCFSGITFVMEVSVAEGDIYVDVQKKSVLNILAHYKRMIAPFQMSTSVIYFSSPDSMNPEEPGRSGILYSQNTNSENAINVLNTTNFQLGAASDLQLGFSKTLESLQNGYLETSNLVIFMARGSYEKLSNCCPDPSETASAVRAISTIQGVVIGPYSSKSQLDLLTGSNSIDANVLIGNTVLNSTQNRSQAANKISDALIPLIDQFIQNQYCPGIPDIVNPPCEDPIDVLFLLHSNDVDNWHRIVNFTSTQLIPDLLGSTGEFPGKTLTTSTPMNFAIASYYYLDVVIHADFTYLRSINDYQSLLNSLPFKATQGTATLSTAYKKAIEIFEDGRPYASKNVILITDTVDASDAENSFSEHTALVELVGGFTSALSIRTSVLSDSIPGVDYQITVESSQLDNYNKYSMRQMANYLTQKTCVYMPLQFSTNAPPSPSPTLPGPIPLIKGRNVWSDITILIDTSNESLNPMTDLLFEKVRTFIELLSNQYSVGEKGSRFTIATFDGITVDYSCIFSQVNNYYDLSTCRNEKLTFLLRTHQNYRDISSVLANVRENVYENDTSGYRSLNENYLIIFTLGSSSTDFNQEIVKIQRKGIRALAIGLTNSMPAEELSLFGQSVFQISDWDSVYSGIDTNTNLANTIFQITTKKRTPSTSNFFGNVVFIVDQSKNAVNDFSYVVNYVTDFVKPFLVNSVKAQISIVPFAEDVLNPLRLSSSSQAVDQWLSTWKMESTSESYSANVDRAIDFVSQSLEQIHDRPTYVVYVLGATNVTGYENSVKRLQQCNLFVASYNSTLNTTFGSLVLSTHNLYTVTSSQKLLDRVFDLNSAEINPVLLLEKDIFETQEKADQTTFPTSSIAADVVFLLDETGLTDIEFSIMKNFLTDFTGKFSVGPQSTQFALQTYNGRTIPHDGFHLFESTNEDAVSQKIQHLTLAKATENSTDADLAGAIEQELFFFLTEKNGWRDDVTTYTIILSHADSFYTRDTATASAIKNVSSVFALGLNGMRFDYVQNFTNTNFYETVPNVTLLSTSNPAITDLLTTINNDYKNTIYPKTINVKTIVDANFIFLIDNAVGTNSVGQVKSFLNNFMFNIATFSSTGNDTKLAVVTYGQSTVTQFNLQSAQDLESLQSNIAQLQIPTSSGNSNLRRAIDAVILNEVDFGVSFDRPNYIIVIAESQTVDPVIDPATSQHLNTRYSTFLIQKTYDTNAFSYASKVLGTQWFSDRIMFNPMLDFENSQMQNVFVPWIANEYSSWTNTFKSQF